MEKTLKWLQGALLAVAAAMLLTVVPSGKAQAAASYNTVFATPSAVNCSSDSLCALLKNITVQSVTIGPLTGAFNYAWNGTCPGTGTTSGPVYIAPTGTSAGCFVETGPTNGYVQHVATLADLEALGSLSGSTLSTVDVDSYYSGGTSGGGKYVWNSTSTTNDCLHVAATGVTTGRWVLTQNGPLNIDQCGANGSLANNAPFIADAIAASTSISCSQGVTYKITTTISVTVAGETLDFKGCKIDPYLFSPSTNPEFDVEANNFTANNMFFMAGSGGHPFVVGTSATISSVHLHNLTCDGSDAPPLSGCIILGNVTDFRLIGWRDVSDGYGVLQQSGTNSHGVLISDFFVSDSYSDPIAENSVTGNTTNWNVIHGVYTGAHGYPALATENRFASFTDANGVNISDVQVADANGDSCVHLEGNATNVSISNSTFTGCLGYYIEYNNTANSLKLTNVTCNYTAAGQGQYCVTGIGNPYSNPIFATNVTCNDTSGLHAFSCFDLSAHTAPVNIVGGGGNGLLDFINLYGTQQLTVSSVNVTDCTNGVYDSTTTGTAIKNITLLDNYFSCSNYDFYTTSFGSVNPDYLTLVGNYFDNSIAPTNIPGVLGVGVANGFSEGNTYSYYMTNTTIASSPYATVSECHDYQRGTGMIHTACSTLP